MSDVKTTRNYKDTLFGSLFYSCDEAIENAKKSDKPSVIVAKTIKGKGVSFMENNPGWHGTAPKEPDYIKALEELK